MGQKEGSTPHKNLYFGVLSKVSILVVVVGF